MALGVSLIDASGVSHPMAGLLRRRDKLREAAHDARLSRGAAVADCALGAAGAALRGHEFHYATIVSRKTMHPSLSSRTPMARRPRRRVREAASSPARSSMSLRRSRLAGHCGREVPARIDERGFVGTLGEETTAPRTIDVRMPLDHFLDEAVEGGERIGQNRRALASAIHSSAFEPAGTGTPAASAEPVRQLLVPRREHVDRERARLPRPASVDEERESEMISVGGVSDSEAIDVMVRRRADRHRRMRRSRHPTTATASPCGRPCCRHGADAFRSRAGPGEPFARAFAIATCAGKPSREGLCEHQ